MDFDFFQITGKWNAAKVTRRADKLEEAERASDELERGGASNVEIIGVKAGKREKIRGQRKPAKPAKKKSPEKTRARKKTPAKRTKTAVKTKGTTGDYITDFKTEKKAKAAAENIRGLGFETEIVEPRGQLDLFAKPLNKRFDIIFTNKDLIFISASLGLLKDENKKISSTLKFKELKECILRARNRDKDVNINLDSDELNIICNALQKYYKISFNEDVNKLYKQLLNLSFPYNEI